jgi:hypothetical protein
MTLVKLNDVPQRSTDFVCRESRLARWSTVVGTTAVLTVTVWQAVVERQWFLYVVAAVLALMLWLFVQMLRVSYRPTNWLMRIATDGTVWIKFRSYLNHHLPGDVPQVVRLSRGEVHWARVVRETVRSNHGSDSESESVVSVEMAVTDGEFGDLRAALARERDPKGHGEAGYGRFHHDVPLRTGERCLLLLTYRSSSRRTTPGLAPLMRALKRITTVRPTERVEVDLRVAGASNAELDQRIIELVERNDIFAAMDAARDRYGMSVTDATRYVDELVKSAGSRASG